MTDPSPTSSTMFLKKKEKTKSRGGGSVFLLNMFNGTSKFQSNICICCLEHLQTFNVSILNPKGVVAFRVTFLTVPNMLNDKEHSHVESFNSTHTLVTLKISYACKH